MNYDCQRVCDLSESDFNTWEKIRAADRQFDSPFFHSELTRLTASIRDDVEVVRITDDGQPVGFFPFIRLPSGLAQNIPGRLSEFHGVVAGPSVNWCPHELVSAAGLRAWYFDHLPTSQAPLEGAFWRETPSPFLDLSDGFAAYRSEVKSRGSSLSNAERKGRKLAREVGPLTFEFHSTGDESFSSLIDWKTAQHERTKVLPVLRVEWVHQLLQSLRSVETESFAGVLSVLRAGDQPIAVHLGMRTETNLHIWFPAYDVCFEKYSPGLVLLLRLAEEAAERGITRIDFGRGTERYKQNFKSGDTSIACGAVDTRLLAGVLRRRWDSTKHWMRTSRFHQQLEIPLTASRQIRQWLKFR